MVFSHLNGMIVLFLVASFIVPNYSQILGDKQYDDQILDINTRLDLSPWELFVINELVLKLATPHCFNESRKIVTQFKEAVSSTFTKAPRSEVQNVEFLPTYNRLVRCMEYVENKMETGKKDKEMELEEPSSESDWILPEPSEATDPLVIDDVEEKEFNDEEQPYGMFGTLTKSIQWILQLGSRQDKTRKHSKETMEERKKRLDLSYKKARENVGIFFHGVSKVVEKTCPKIHRPNKTFLREALLDVATWATHDRHDTIALSNFYLESHQLIKLIMKCNIS